MIKHLRTGLLLYILVFVALGQFLSSSRSTDWDKTLWVDVYLHNGSESTDVQSWIDNLKPDAYAAVEEFLSQQARAGELALEQPFRIRIAGQLDKAPPTIPENGNPVAVIVWSLRMRWLATRLRWGSDGPAPDIVLIAAYHEPAAGISLDRSTALRKGLIAVANVIGNRSARGSNQVVIAHELLHTLGASDKYDPTSTLPVYPDGYAEPERQPRHPQSLAELMAGRTPQSATEAVIPRSLEQVVIGPLTAGEIGWAVVP